MICTYCRGEFSGKCTRHMHHRKRIRIPGWRAVSVCAHWLFSFLRWVAIEMGRGYVGANDE